MEHLSHTLSLAGVFLSCTNVRWSVTGNILFLWGDWRSQQLAQDAEAAGGAEVTLTLR